MSTVAQRFRRGLAVAAVSAGIAVSLAGPASAAPDGSVVIDTGQLIVTGTNHADNITLSVPATDTSVVEVDFGDGMGKCIVKWADFIQIQITSRGGNDVVRIDYGAEV